MPELPNSISSAPFDFNAYNENRIVEVSKLLSFVAPTIKRLHIFYCPFFKEKIATPEKIHLSSKLVNLLSPLIT